MNFGGLDSDSNLRAADVYITKLRDKFSNCDSFEIKTVRGIELHPSCGTI